MVPQRGQNAKEQSILRGHWIVSVIKYIDQELLACLYHYRYEDQLRGEFSFKQNKTLNVSSRSILYNELSVTHLKSLLWNQKFQNMKCAI